jgi:hypothetical protein
VVCELDEVVSEEVDELEELLVIELEEVVSEKVVDVVLIELEELEEEEVVCELLELEVV